MAEVINIINKILHTFDVTTFHQKTKPFSSATDKLPNDVIHELPRLAVRLVVLQQLKIVYTFTFRKVRVS